MAITQLGNTSLSVASIIGLSAGALSNVSISNINTLFMGDSAASGIPNVSQSKISLYYEQECVYSKGTEGSGFVAPIPNTINSTVGGWRFHGVDTPWKPSRFSDFQFAANARPTAAINRIGTGNELTFNLAIQCAHADPAGAIFTAPLLGGMTNTYYVWLTGPSFPLGFWRATAGDGTININNLLKGENYRIYVQDSLGAGNQFETYVSFSYPPNDS